MNLSLLLLLALPLAMAFTLSSNVAGVRRSMAARSLDDSTIQKLDDIRAKFESLANIPEAEAERAQMADTVEKYATYREIRGMMKKLRIMFKGEASERRQAKQLKSFVDLYKGRLEIEEALKEKLGQPSRKESLAIRELDEIAKLDAEIAALEKKLGDVELTIPKGMTTREERFGY